VIGAVAAALGAAALFAVASAVQHQEANAVEKGTGAQLLVSLARRPLWLLGICSDFLAVALQALALGLGSVPLVQTLLVAGLPLAALLSALLQHRRMFRFEVVGMLLCTPGIALLAPALSSTASEHDPSRVAACVAGAIVAVVALPLLAARHQPRFGGLYAGLAAGAVLGAGSVLLAVAAGRFGDWSALFGSWAVYAAAAVGVAGLLLAQIAFQTGDLGAPLAALSITEPLVAVVLAVTVLKDDLPTSGASLTAAVAGTLLSVAGVLALCRAPEPVPALSL
jgi:drug/metabolite transporter (DMT)-like permease